ncbi:MAG: 1,4-alpha-glucan branching protein GlgB [Bacteroidales bacterium]
MPHSSATPADPIIESLVHGANGDPFATLGPHLTDRPGVLVVRAYHPYAVRASLVRPEVGDVEMTRVHPGGVFEARVPTDVLPLFLDYRLRIEYEGGIDREIDDPYRYGVLLNDADLDAFGHGEDRHAYRVLGSHLMTVGSTSGVHFAVWAPNASRVSVVGDFNGWDGRVNPMRFLPGRGVWAIFMPGLKAGDCYKYEVRSAAGQAVQKADPYGTRFEVPPLTATIVHEPQSDWQDQWWMDDRRNFGCWLDRPMSIYEVHLASWARVPEDENRFLTYRELADTLVPYVKDLGFTHIELLPVMEHPFLGSWGYQVTGFFAPTSRFGTPEDFKALVDACHRASIGVLLDWVPGHFPKDAYGLAMFDGTALYEHADPRQGEHRDWGTLIFNYGRDEVRSFLLSNAHSWLNEYHVDGLRVDAVASMLYLDYSREHGDWLPNRFGGRENLEAIDFLHRMNSDAHAVPGVITAAEESTAWPGVSRPVYLGGLGFTYKWNMGWMHDILKYCQLDPIHRRWAHNQVTFSMLYAYHENFILPFSHDEVVHGKGSMIGKMPGDEWQRFANLRTLYTYFFTHPGKKLLFMGGEFGQVREWNYDNSLDWDVVQYPVHGGVQHLVRDLNRVYREQPSLHQLDYDPAGFQWIDCNDNENSVFSFIRRARDASDFTLTILNFTPVPRDGYRIGVPEGGRYLELVNSDSALYAGSNMGNGGSVSTEQVPSHGYPQSLRLVLPPLAGLVFKLDRG